MKVGVFFDRDGTIMIDKGYIERVEDVELCSGAAEAIRRLNELGLPAVVVSNQSGVARGFFSEERVRQIHGRLEELLEQNGARLEAIYFCPHHPDFGRRRECSCRKPKAGLVEQAAALFQIDLGRSYVVGDKIIDIELGERVGAKRILVLTGYGQESLREMRRRGARQPDFIASDLVEAVRWIEGDLG